MYNSEKVVSINEIKYKKYGYINYDNTALVYKQIHKVNHKRNIRKEMIKGYLEMLTKYYNKRSE
jgi:hypothetical protein